MKNLQNYARCYPVDEKSSLKRPYFCVKKIGHFFAFVAFLYFLVVPQFALSATLNISYNCSANSYQAPSVPGDILVITLTAACKTQSGNYGTNVTLNSIVSSTGVSKTIALSTLYSIGDVFTYTVGSNLGVLTLAGFINTGGTTQYGVYAATPNIPNVSAISPSSGSANGGTSVTITSSSIRSFQILSTGGVWSSVVTGVTIGGKPVQSYSVTSDTTLTAITPESLSIGPASVVVTNTVGSSSANTLFTYAAPPTATANSTAAQKLTLTGAMTNITPLTGSGGTAPLTYYVSSGTLPNGISLNASTGVISGTPTATYSTADVVIGVKDANNLPASTTATVSFTAVARPTTSTNTTTRTLAVGLPISSFTPITGTGGTAPLTYFISSGTLPSGLTLDSTTGLVSGTPTAAYSSATVTFGVKDANNITPASSSTSSVSIAVNKGSQTISYTSTAPPSATIGGDTYTPIATSTSGLALTLTIDASSASVCSLSGGVVTFTGSGTCKINANQSGNTDYNAAAQVQQTFTVLGRPTAVASTTAQTLTAGIAMASFTPLTGAGGSSTLTYYISSGTLPAGLSLSASTGAVTGTPTGAFATSNIVFAVKDANNSLATTTSTVSFTVNLATPLLSGFSLSSSNLVYGASAPTITAPTSASSGAITYSSSNTSVATVNGSTITIVGVGTTTLTATQAANGNYETASTTKTLTVAAASTATLSGLALSSGTLSPTFASGTGSYTASVTNATNSITVTPTVTDSNATVTVNGITVNSGSASGAIFLNVGSNTITAVVTAQDGTTTKAYSIAVTREAMPTLTFSTPNTATVPMGGALTNAATSNYSGGSYGAISYTSATPAVATVNSSGVITPVSAGTSVITATQAAVAGVNTSASQTYTLTVSLANQSITASSTSSSINVGATSTVSASAGSGTGAVTYSSSNTAVATVDSSTGVVTGISASSVTITATKAADSTYASASATTSITVTATPTPTLTFTTQNTASVMLSGALTNAATTSIPSGGTISYTSSVPSVATVNASGVITPLTAGTSVITATQAASAGVNTQVSTTYTLTVNALLTPTLTFATPTAASVVLGGALTNAATSSNSGGSFGAISYSSSNTSVATVNSSSGAITTVAAGTAVITATQAAVAGVNAQATQTYTLTVQSTNASLSNLSLSIGVLSPTFASGSYAYSASVVNATTSITVTPIVAQSNATVKVNGTTVASGSASGSISLSVGSNTITTVVTAQDGTTTQTYTTTVTRAASSTATLSGLSLSSGVLSPTFSSGTTTYTASVTNATTSITVTPTVTEANSTVKVNGTTVASGAASGSISLNVGSNTITTVVTAQDGTTTQTYTTTVTRAAASTATLSGLNLSSGTLSPTFASGTTSYTASVTNATNTITVTPTVTDINSTVKVNGTTVASGSASGSVSLNVGSNTITTVVTAQDGTTTQTYTATVTRAVAAPTVTSLNPSSGSTLGGTSVTITGTDLTGATGVTIGGVAATSVIVNSATSITATTPAGTAGTASVVVTTPAGSNAANTAYTYVAPASNNANLTGLTLSSGALTPAFSSGTIAYTQSVASSVSSITVTPTVNQANATVTVNGTAVATGVASGSINLNVGPNTITTVVTAQDGTTTKTYTTTVTRAAAASTDANLSGLTYSSGALTPAFASGTIAYTQSVANTVSSITVTPTVSQANATVTVNGTAVATGVASGSINLNVGANVITTVVTAQDGTTTKTYTTAVTRAAALQAQTTLVVVASPANLNATTTTSTLSTTGGSGTGAVSYAMTAGTCTLSGSTVTAGTSNETCTVTATKAADSTYLPATATVNITVSRRATLAAAATDASVGRTQTTQMMQTQKFVQAQVQNITSHLDTFRHNFNLSPSNMGVSLITPSMGPMTPLFYKVKDVWSGNTGESTASSLQKVGMKEAAGQANGSSRPLNDYNNPDELDEQARIEERIYAYERKQETYSLWSAGTIDTGLFKTGDNKDISNKFRVNGLTFGLDYKVGPRAIVGAAFGIGQGTNASPELQSTVKSTQRSLSGYGMLGFGNNWVVDGLLGYSSLSFTGDRTTADGAASLGMNRKGNSAFASTSISKIFSVGSLRIAPFLREDVTQIRLGQYAETGATDYALGYDTTRYTATTSSAGLHFSNDVYLDHGKLTTTAKFSGNRMKTGAIAQDVYYVDSGMAGGIYTLQQNSSYQSSRSLNLGITYSNKAGDGIDIGWMGAMGANQYKLNGLRFGMRFAM